MRHPDDDRGPMHPSIWRKMLEAAREEKAKGEEYRLAKQQAAKDEYFAKLAARRDELERGAGDISQHLRRVGCNEVHVKRLAEWETNPPKPLATLKTAKEWVQTRSETQRPFLLLLGPSGNGKTFAATYTLAKLAKAYAWNGQAGGGAQGEPCLFVRVQALERIGGFDDEAKRFAAELARTRLLVLDDLGTENLSPSAQSALHQLVDSRWGAQRHTVITSNLSLKALSKRLDGAVPGRFSRRLTENAMVLEDEVVLAAERVRALLTTQGVLQ